MKKVFSCLTVFALTLVPAFAQTAHTKIWRPSAIRVSAESTLTTGGKSAWSVQSPAGSSDFFNVVYPVRSGSPTTEGVVAGMAVEGVSVSVADFGSTTSFTQVGVF